MSANPTSYRWIRAGTITTRRSAWFGEQPEDHAAHYPSIKPELVELTSALHGLAHHDTDRKQFVADARAYADKFKLSSEQREALIKLDVPGIVKMGAHPLVPFLAKCKYSVCANSSSFTDRKRHEMLSISTACLLARMRCLLWSKRRQGGVGLCLALVANSTKLKIIRINHHSTDRQARSQGRPSQKSPRVRASAFFGLPRIQAHRAFGSIARRFLPWRLMLGSVPGTSAQSQPISVWSVGGCPTAVVRATRWYSRLSSSPANEGDALGDMSLH